MQQDNGTSSENNNINKKKSKNITPTPTEPSHHHIFQKMFYVCKCLKIGINLPSGSLSALVRCLWL